MALSKICLSPLIVFVAIATFPMIGIFLILALTTAFPKRTRR